MDLYETIVLWYLTKDAYVFISPQYSIRSDAGGEWSCPDFVALNFKDRRVSVVEVSTAFDPDSLLRKVRNRDRQWFDRLKSQLKRNSVVDDTWLDYRVEVFVRRQAASKFKKELGPDVLVTVLEDLRPPWEWERRY